MVYITYWCDQNVCNKDTPIGPGIQKITKRTPGRAWK